MKPYLFRFRKNKQSTTVDELMRVEYDAALSQTVVVYPSERKIAVLDPLAKNLATKKEDLETGEDAKDRWMFGS